MYFRYDALLRQHQTLQENLRKRSPSYFADSLDGGGQIEALQKDNDALQQEINELQEKFMQYESTRSAGTYSHHEDDFIDLKRKYEALEMEYDRLKSQVEDYVDRTPGEAVFAEAGLQSR